MAIVSKSFIHDRSKMIGASGDDDGILPEDIQDYVTANISSTLAGANLNVTMCPIDGNRVLTLVVVDNS